MQKTSKCISEREAVLDVVEEDVVINDTELYEVGLPAHDDDDEDDHMLLPPVEEGEVAHGDMPSYAETGSFDANMADTAARLSSFASSLTRPCRSSRGW